MINKAFWNMSENFKIDIEGEVKLGKICKLPFAQVMKRAKIYIPSKTVMQSGRGKKKWVLTFESKNTKTSLPFYFVFSTRTSAAA